MKMSYAIYRVAELVFVLSTCFVMTLSPSAYAATFTVDSTADTVDANPGDRICADEIGNCTLRAAIIEANADDDLHDVINLPTGTYALSIEGRNEDASFTGDLDITDNLTINGAVQTDTVIDANAIDRVLHIIESSIVEISDVTVTGGNDDYDSDPAAGGILNEGTVFLTNCTIRNNDSLQGGGGMANFGAANLTDCIISENSAPSGLDAGGIANASGAILTMTNCTISNNDGGAGWGGIENGGIAFLANCTITGNIASDLGEAGGIANAGILTVTSCFVSDNEHIGIVNKETGVANLVGSTIANNYDRGEGAAGNITNSNSADLRIENSTILTGQGTGLSVEDGTVEILNTTFSGFNQAAQGWGDGGHPGIGVGEGTVRVTNSTITEHGEASSGGGIGVDGGGTLTLQNSIVVGNTACCGGADCEGPVTSLGNNIVGDCSMTLQPTDNPGEAGLGSFVDTGKPGGGYYPLLAYSDAIDNGNDAACTSTDQIGNPRDDGDGNGSTVCDIGAIEFQNGLLVDLSGHVYAERTLPRQDICAMVLASGQFMFSCNPPGEFFLTDLPREMNGTVKRQVYADGFLPMIDILTRSTDDNVAMTYSGTCTSYNTPYEPGIFPGSAGNRINIAGKVLSQNSQIPVCAMVLANGQYIFSCDGTGNYALNIPLDNNGQYKLQVYADGFAPTIQTFDEFQAMNDVRMARAVECQ